MKTQQKSTRLANYFTQEAGSKLVAVITVEIMFESISGVTSISVVTSISEVTSLFEVTSISMVVI